LVRQSASWLKNKTKNFKSTWPLLQ
jgi:hypothetical protein